MILQDAEPRSTSSRGGRLWPVFAIALGVICHLGGLFNDFTYDDCAMVRDNPRIRSLTAFREIWLTDWWSEQSDDQPYLDPTRDRLYRPLTLFSFALNYALHENRPFGYHLVNLVLHALACWLVWRFARRLFDDELIAGTAALLFAVHPVHTEAVAGVVGRGEILATVFMLGGLLALLPRGGSPTSRRLLLSLPLFVAALLSKETAVCFPVMALIALHAVYGARREPLKPWFTRAAWLALPLLAYLPLRWYALGGRLVRVKLNSLLFLPLHDATLFERIHGPFTILGHYARLLLTPNNLSCDYGPAVFDPRRGPDTMTLVGLLAAASLAAALSGYLRSVTTHRRLAVCAAMFLGSYVLISNSVMLIGISFADRLMYWPSVPVVTGLAVGAAWFWKTHCAAPGARRSRMMLTRICALGLLFALGLRSIVRTADWKNNETLFAADLTTDPANPILNNAYAGILMSRARRLDAFVKAAGAPAAELAQATAERDKLLDLAETLLRRSVDAEARFSDALVRFGDLHVLRGDTRRAVECLQRALLLNPADMKAKRLLTRLHGDETALRARVEDLTRIIQERPDDLHSRTEIARALIDLGRADEALPQAETAARLAPENAEALKLYAEALLLNLRHDDALKIYQRVLSFAPTDWEAHSNLVTLLSSRDPAAALHHALTAHELQPDDLRTRINLAEAYALNGRIDEALGRFHEIARLLPEPHPHRELVTQRIAELERITP